MEKEFTGYGGTEPFETNSLVKAQTEGRRLADLGVMTECRDSNFDHVFTMGEN